MHSLEKISACMSCGIEKISNAIRMMAENIRETFSKFINVNIAGIKLADEIINQYPNCRVKHLALYAKKGQGQKEEQEAYPERVLQKAGGEGMTPGVQICLIICGTVIAVWGMLVWFAKSK